LASLLTTTMTSAGDRNIVESYSVSGCKLRMETLEYLEESWSRACRNTGTVIANLEMRHAIRALA
jgi:hypothetical protein